MMNEKEMFKALEAVRQIRKICERVEHREEPLGHLFNLVKYHAIQAEDNLIRVQIFKVTQEELTCYRP